MKGAANLPANGPGIGWPNECKRRSNHSRFVPGGSASEASLPEQFHQLGLDGGADLRAIDLPGRQAFQDQAFDVDVDAHAMAWVPFLFSTEGEDSVSFQRSSDSLTGRSSLRNSVRAAASTIGMVTFERASAAVKQALSATL